MGRDRKSKQPLGRGANGRNVIFFGLTRLCLVVVSCLFSRLLMTAPRVAIISDQMVYIRSWSAQMVLKWELRELNGVREKTESMYQCSYECFSSEN